MNPGADVIVRAVNSFDRGNVNDRISKGETNVPKGKGASPGPYFAEYDVTAETAGEYQLDFMNAEKGERHRRHLDQRQVGELRGRAHPEPRSVSG